MNRWNLLVGFNSRLNIDLISFPLSVQCWPAFSTVPPVAYYILIDYYPSGALNTKPLDIPKCLVSPIIPLVSFSTLPFNSN